MNKNDENQLKIEIAHIFESGANEIRIFNMIENFINKRNQQNQQFLINWEQYKKSNWWQSDAIDVEKILMDQFLKLNSF